METRELFEILKEKAEMAAGRLPADLAAAVFVELTGPDPAQWLALAADGRLSLTEGPPPASVDITVTLAGETAVKLYQRTVSPMAAFLTGKVRIKGDPQKIALLKGLLTSR